MPNELEAILQWKMTQDQAKAYKLCLIWQDLCQREFPDYNCARLRSVGDPRKSLIFRHMLKLVTSTKGIIKDTDYRLYIQAQLTMLKTIAQGKALISPAILTGERAWKRWRYWKYHYDKRELTKPNVEKAPEHLVIEELKKTLQFLSNRYPQLGRHHISQAVSDGLIKKWLSYKEISPYYVVLSPLTVGHDLGIDVGVYQRSITPNIESFFKQAFSYEFA